MARRSLLHRMEWIETKVAVRDEEDICALLCSSIFPLLLERQQKLRTQIVYNGLPKFLGRLLYAYLHPLLGADELSE